MRNHFVSLILLFLISSCSKDIYLHRIKTYLNAADTTTKAKYLSENFHSFFEERKGEGKDKVAAMRSFLNWDAPLHPDIKIISYTIHGNEWTVVFNEQNDFTKPIGFPGWKGTAFIRFNDKKQIEETIYIPDPGNPPYKKWLQPALDWLQKNKPAGLNEVYQDNKLIQTNETAKKWASLLKLWKKETSK